jgi:transcriptional regulator with XRE-family HTH domain
MDKAPAIPRGMRKKIASRAGISQQHLSNLLHRSRRASCEVAKKLERATKQLLSKRIAYATWMCADNTTHPAFAGPPMILR